MGDTGNYLDHIRKGRMGRGDWLLLGCCRFLRGRHRVRQSWCKSKKEAVMLLIRRGLVPDPNQPMLVSRDLETTLGDCENTYCVDRFSNRVCSPETTTVTTIEYLQTVNSKDA